MLDTRDNNYSSINKPEPLETMPKGLRILFLVYLQSLNNKTKETYQEQITEFRQAGFETPEVSMHDFFGNILVGMALSKLDKQLPALDLEMEPSIDFEKEIIAFNKIVTAAKKSILESFQNHDQDDTELGNETRAAVFAEAKKSEQRLRFVKELMDVMDGEDWYHLGLFFFELTDVYDNLAKRQRVTSTKSLPTTALFREKFISPNIELDKDFDDVLNGLLKTLFEQYYPMMRASKVYKFMRHQILIDWFANVISTLDSPDGITPKLDKETIQKLQDLHDDYRYGPEDFITNPESEETKAQMIKYNQSSEYINTIMQKLLSKYLKEADIQEAMQEEIQDTLEEEVVEKISDAEVMVKQLMEVFNAMK
jgi:hypothetical protein